MGKRYLCGLDVEEIGELIKAGGFNHAQAVTVAGMFYKKGVPGLNETTRIPKSLKKYLYDVAQTGIYPPVKSEESADGTKKYLFISPEGKKFETVYIPEGKRKTVCVSTQSGCRMGCPFCVTGGYGFHGNLTARDIVNQVLGIPCHNEVTHVVFMGMGEPLDNPDNVLKAVRIFSAEWGMAISPRNITVSTVGITPAFIRFLRESECNLALSLYSPFSEERAGVVPAEKIYPVREIISIMAACQLSRKRRLSLAYIMIQGVNDTGNHLNELISLTRNTRIRVNLLPYHAVRDDDKRSSSEGRLQFFKHNLVMAGISASVRKSRGEDISAACGLLASGMR
ncbi:MAG TPA: 23S rRNA (adenine(2503)-C(2))-methyltransferase RlmN [Bacteroidales bacterium]|nr:23S rRNA (adenine(2503)-C(2))-methyltransferase RlmN [Bacteroidales bacterium]